MRWLNDDREPTYELPIEECTSVADFKHKMLKYYKHAQQLVKDNPREGPKWVYRVVGSQIPCCSMITSESESLCRAIFELWFKTYPLISLSEKWFRNSPEDINSAKAWIKDYIKEWSAYKGKGILHYFLEDLKKPWPSQYGSVRRDLLFMKAHTQKIAIKVYGSILVEPGVITHQYILSDSKLYEFYNIDESNSRYQYGNSKIFYKLSNAILK